MRFHTHTHTATWCRLCVCSHTHLWSITQRQIPVCYHSSMWHSIYLTAGVSPECYISSVPLSVVFRRGSGSTGLPRCMCISNKAQRRATVTLSDLWQRGASEEALPLRAGWQRVSAGSFAQNSEHFFSFFFPSWNTLLQRDLDQRLKRSRKTGKHSLL